MLESGVVIPKTDITETTSQSVSESGFKNISESVLSVADGVIVELSDIKDPVFSQKMMGDGFAIEPKNGNVYAPVSGIVTSIFPTKHAFGLLTDNGLEVLVHIGLDTVALNGTPFSIKVVEGQRVVAGDLLVVADLTAIKSADRETIIVVVFTNTAEIKSVTLTKRGKQVAKAVVAEVEL